MGIPALLVDSRLTSRTLQAKNLPAGINFMDQHKHEETGPHPNKGTRVLYRLLAGKGVDPLLGKAAQSHPSGLCVEASV